MNRFKELRENRNISLEKLSSILKTNISTLSRIENCQREPKQSTIEDYANFFNVSIDYLLGFSDNPNVNKDKNILTESEQSILNDYSLLNVNEKKEKENNIEKIGKRLKDLRQEKNITQEELGKILGTSHVTIGRYENGERIPKLDILMDLANYFSVSLDYLLFRSDKKEVSFNTDKSNLSFVNEKKLPIVEDYNKLNDEGKKEAEKRVKELTFIPFYKDNNTVTISINLNKPIDEEIERLIEKINEIENQ